ncbi:MULTISPECIES: CheR family methyltransferase [Vreelandella]|uniref:Chemotaxis protein methyltransferase n=2 Tax=Vreelandella TaxID=3137766 RepID=A0A7C9NPB7_9GAMM|nr:MULTISPECIES: CheR family methyltransferase [Halomonas]NDL70048.1 chemotaxis protein CheR [Halomonas alkaliphila]NYS46029.1 chemotaxis protein CheR [Halomonas zhaodongensis]
MIDQRERGAEASQWASGGQIERDLVLTDADFSRIRELIYLRAGIVLAEHKREMVYSRLAKRLRHHGITRFTDYLSRLERQPDAKEWEAFTNALTTNLTAFFREAHHFPLLAEHIKQKQTPVTIWCSAASTGEEPYSIAMTLLETLGPKAAQAKVVATDIDTDALSKARAGIYPLEQVRKLDDSRVKRFFQKGTGGHAGLARVRPEVSALVEFVPLNLLAPQWSVKGPFDAVFCRNIMIYFDKDTQAKILKRFAPLMKPDALLFAGHSENFSYISDAFKLRGQTVYTLAKK